MCHVECIDRARRTGPMGWEARNGTRNREKEEEQQQQQQEQEQQSLLLSTKPDSAALRTIHTTHNTPFVDRSSARQHTHTHTHTHKHHHHHHHRRSPEASFGPSSMRAIRKDDTAKTPSTHRRTSKRPSATLLRRTILPNLSNGLFFTAVLVLSVWFGFDNPCAHNNQHNKNSSSSSSNHHNDNHNDNHNNMTPGAASTVARAVSPMAKQPYKLLQKTRLSHDSFLLRYGLPEGRAILGTDPALPTCVKVDFVDEQTASKTVSKSYSPVSHPSAKGFFDLVVKAYPYRSGGGVGAYLCDMAVGDSIAASLKKERSMHGSPAVLGRGWKHVGLVAGGTGIAPLLQIARILLEDKGLPEEDRPRVHLLFVNHTPSDVLGREEIEALQKDHPYHFFVTHSFTREGPGADPRSAPPGSPARVVSGRGDVAMAVSSLPDPSGKADTMVLVCGRDGFVAHWAGPVGRGPPKPDGSKGPKVQGPLLGVLSEAGFEADQVFKY